MPPAARVGDMHTCPLVNPGPVPHVGGPILPPGGVTVLIGGVPAARMGDMCTCVGPPDTIAMGSPTVLIGNMLAARMGDPTMHGGVIVLGAPTVMIGESGGAGGGPGGGGGAGGAASVAAGMGQTGLSDSDSENSSAYASSGGESFSSGGDAGAAGSSVGSSASGATPAGAAGSSVGSSAGAAGGPADQATGGSPDSATSEAGYTPGTQREGFETKDDAARAALDECNDKSIAENREYSGVVYKSPDGTYGYTQPQPGEEDGANVGNVPRPGATDLVGDYHTHGDYGQEGYDENGNPKSIRTSDPDNDTYNSGDFSTTDKKGIAASAENRPGYVGYVGTPNGDYKKYDPDSGDTTTM